MSTPSRWDLPVSRKSTARSAVALKVVLPPDSCDIAKCCAVWLTDCAMRSGGRGARGGSVGWQNGEGRAPGWGFWWWVGGGGGGGSFVRGVCRRAAGFLGRPAG